jgi:glyoxylase-like metal-dependent hydrolase (beta-lactamase superfamily II)
VDEGEDVSGFRVIHLPGHAPGLIALLRERDGVALTSDAFYTLNDQTGLRSAPRLPHPAFHHDREQAAASLRKLAALAPSAAWPGHAEPVTGDVAAQLERAATT